MGPEAIISAGVLVKPKTGLVSGPRRGHRVTSAKMYGSPRTGKRDPILPHE